MAGQHVTARRQPHPDGATAGTPTCARRRRDVLLVLVLLAGWVGDARAPCPDLCTCTPWGTPTTVDCSQKDLKDFPEGIPYEVEVLNVADNWIQNIPRLTQYPSLRVIDISGNRISYIPEKTFQELRNLQKLDLSSNNIKSLLNISAFTIFKTNENLDTLILSQNQITNFDGSSSIASESIKILDLSSNSISTLGKKTLAWLPKLMHLNMSRNPIKWAIDLTSSTLVSLDLSYGQMDGISRNQLEKMPQLQTLKISQNRKFNLYFTDLKSDSLRNYEADFCQLSSPGLTDFPNLISANLEGNRIEILRAKALLKNEKLERLDMSGNGLKEIEPDSFLGLTNIKFLHLGNNKISVLSWDMFLTNHELKFLNLSNNPISKLPSNFTLSKLIDLDLSECQIQVLDERTFSRLPVLSYLDLSRNLLEQVPNNLESNSIKTLNLSLGRISSMNNQTFSKIKNLRSLSLVGNRLTTVPRADMFNSNPDLKSIYLSDNPWICECKDSEFKIFWEFLTEPPPKVEGDERNLLRCMSPPTVVGKTWEQACHAEFYPPLQTNSFFDVYGVYILVVAMALSFVLVVCVSIRERMRKREKRHRLEETRRNARERQDRVIRELHESMVALNSVHGDDARSPPERVISQPPTYEEAVLMPRRLEAASREELDRINSSGYAQDDDSVDEPHEGTTRPIIEVVSRQEVSSLLRQASEPRATPTRVAPKPPGADQGSDYDEIAVTSDEGEDEVDTSTGGGGGGGGGASGGRRATSGAPRVVLRAASDCSNAAQGRESMRGIDEAKLMQQLGIEVWSREDVNTAHLQP